MVILSQLIAKEHMNLQINCINRPLTALFIPPALFSTLICQQFDPWVASFQRTVCVQHIHTLYSFFLAVSHWSWLWWLRRICNTLLTVIYETEELFAFGVDARNGLLLRKF